MRAIACMSIILLFALLAMLTLLILFLLQTVVDRIEPVLDRRRLGRRLRGWWHRRVVILTRTPLRCMSLLVVVRQWRKLVVNMALSMTSMRLRRSGPTVVLLLRRILVLIVARQGLLVLSPGVLGVMVI